MEHHIIRVRGLPFSTSEEEVIKFFDKCSIKQVHFCKNRDGRPSGGAFIEMETLRDVKEGLKYDRENMGSRYIEVFEAKYVQTHVISTYYLMSMSVDIARWSG